MRTILHTADWHLWHKHKYTRLAKDKHWDRMFEAKIDVLRNTFIPAVSGEEHINYFVIAGDVFEHFNPIEPVRTEFVKIINEIALKVDIVFIMMGNHDCYKGQYALQSIKEALVNEVQNVKIIDSCDFKYEGMRVKHSGVYGFKANNNYIEPPDKVDSRDIFSNDQLVLLGHYHGHQIDGKVTYSGSPYPIDFGEVNDDKFYNLFRITNEKQIKFRKIKIENGIKFSDVDIDAGGWKPCGSKYEVLRIKEDIQPDKEKAFRQLALEAKQELIKDDIVLDVIIDIKVVKDSIKDRIDNNNYEVSNYREIIKSFNLDKKFIDYIYAKFDEVEKC